MTLQLCHNVECLDYLECGLPKSAFIQGSLLEATTFIGG